MDDPLMALHQSVKKSLSSVGGLFYVPPGGAASLSSRLLELHLTLETITFHFSCSVDGETLAITRERQQAVNLGEYGEIGQKDLTGTGPYKPLIGTPLLKVHDLRTNDNSKIGVKLEFNGGLLVLCNWGDDLKVWDKVPELLFADERIEVV